MSTPSMSYTPNPNHFSPPLPPESTLPEAVHPQYGYHPAAAQHVPSGHFLHYKADQSPYMAVAPHEMGPQFSMPPTPNPGYAMSPPHGHGHGHGHGGGGGDDGGGGDGGGGAVKDVKWWKGKKAMLAALIIICLLVIGLIAALAVALSKDGGGGSAGGNGASGVSDDAPTSVAATTTTVAVPSPEETTGTVSDDYVNMQRPETAEGPAGLRMQCPGADNTTYVSTVRDSGRDSEVTYLRSCDTDFNANDIKRVTASNFEDCMDSCTRWNMQKTDDDDECVGVTWNYKGEQMTDNNGCWLKNVVRNFLTGPFIESARILSKN